MVNTQAPKSITLIISLILFIVGIIIVILPYLGVSIGLGIVGLILLIVAWVLLFLGCLITGL
jgi:hypothetical protein